MGLFILLTSTWFHFGGLAESRSSSIPFKFYGLMKYRFLKMFPYNVLSFLGICYNVSMIISDGLNLGLLFLSFGWLDQGSVNLVYLLKVRAVRFVLLLLTFALIFLISCLHLGLCLICSCVSHLCLLFVIFNVSSQSYNFVL